MRPTTSSMLQQNNNNNYPCLNVSASTREMLQKCSRASLPFPSRMELGLGDLPLIRGLRAWALCSKNRRKAGSLLSGGQAPTTSPAGRGVLTSCTRPADVYLNREWGCMGYGLPLGLDARQAGIGSLVTVATLKTSEGSGKTQTQCVFLRTEKGSFLYSTAKPSSAVTAGAASSVVGGWLRAKTGVGRDIPAGRRENGLTPPAHIGVNRVRVRSGRRWRKSSNPAAREKTDVNRKRQQSGREDTAAAFPLEERQEERDKGGLAGKHSPRGEKEEAYTSPRCCHGAAPKSCIQCGKRAQRKESHNECDGGESPTRGASNRLNGEVKGMRKQRQKEEEEEEKGGICGLKSSSSHLAGPNPDLEADHFLPESHSGCDVEEIKKAESNEEERTRNPQDQESVKERKKIDHEEEEGRIKQTSAEIMPVRYESVSVSACASSISTSVSLEPSAPIEGKGCFADHVNCGVPTEQVNSREDHHQGHRQGAEEPGIVGIDKLVVSRLELGDENNTVNESTSGKAQCFIQNVLNPSQPEEKEASSSPQRDPSLFDKKARSVTGNKCDYCTTGLNRAERREELARQANVEENVLERVNPDKGDEPGAIRQRGGICCKLDKCDGKGDDGMQRHTADDRNDSRTREAMSNCAGKDECRSVEFVDDHRGTQKEVRDRCQQTRTPHVEANVTNVACADPSTTLAHSLANPAPTMPPLGSMATGLPCPEAVEEEEVEKEKEGFGVPVRDQKGGHEGNGRLGRQLEEQGSTVANEEERDKEETEEDEFGVFMQAEGEPAWSDEHAMSASVPCESRELVAFENHSIAGESAHGTPGWTDSSFHQSDNTWTAFSQDSSGDGSDGVAQWWPSSALENSRLSANQNLESVFEEAFPSPPCPSSDDPCDLHTVPTLSQLFRARASHDLGLLDGFHDLNKMICQRYRRANGVSRDLLLRSLHLEPPNAESRTAILAVNRHLSPGLLSANRHAQNAAAKRRLSYDHTKNVME